MLAFQEQAENEQILVVNAEIARLQKQQEHHETQRRELVRERLRRRFTASPFGRLAADLILPFLHAHETLRWFAASPAAATQIGWQELGCRVCHMHGVAASLTPTAASSLVTALYWPALQSLVVDLDSPGWVQVLKALGSAGRDEAVTVEGAVPRRHPRLLDLQGLSVFFPVERPSQASLERWRLVEPMLMQFGGLLAAAPLQELVLTDLRSVAIFTMALHACRRHLRVCRASFIGPESRRDPLQLPADGLPALECLMVRHRDFCGQRASRQGRMCVEADPLLSCLRSVRRPERLGVLALAGVRIDGSKEETAKLLRALHSFPGIAVVALRFSVPSTFGTLLPPRTLIGLRCAWPKVGHFAVADMSLHGFDYWPEQMTDFQQLYPHGRVPEPFEVFRNEFSRVLAAEYGTTAEAQWTNLERHQHLFWAGVAVWLPQMPRNEVGRRTAELFPSGL